jgi:hypothetical protein
LDESGDVPRLVPAVNFAETEEKAEKAEEENEGDQRPRPVPKGEDRRGKRKGQEVSPPLSLVAQSQSGQQKIERPGKTEGCGFFPASAEPPEKNKKGKGKEGKHPFFLDKSPALGKRRKGSPRSTSKPLEMGKDLFRFP